MLGYAYASNTLNRCAMTFLAWNCRGMGGSLGSPKMMDMHG